VYPCEDTNIDGVYEDGKLIALNKFEYFTRQAINVHFYLSSGYQGTGKLGEIFNFMKKHYEENTDLLKVLFMVPSTCIHVHKAAEKHGLKKEGHLTQCYEWRQEVVDIIIYGQELDRGDD
jgi:RimJ/RimL family protein N-acetyltransferase